MKKFLAALLLGLLAVVLVSVLILIPKHHKSENQEKLSLSTDGITCKYYNEKSFRKSVTLASPTDMKGITIRGGIVPHHLLADSLISSFFRTVAAQKPEVVIVVAPNHKGLGEKSVNTGNWNWETPFGILTPDEGIIKNLTGTGTAALNKSLLEEDHSISGLVPYIKYYMPDAKIVPIMLHGNYGLQNSELLGKRIAGLVKDKNYLIIASIDFSHYLTEEVADKKDKITYAAIENRDLQKISHMNNDYLDSPPSLITFLSAMNASGAKDMKLLGHSNSAKIAGVRSTSTTSYFTMVFY